MEDSLVRGALNLECRVRAAGGFLQDFDVVDTAASPRTGISSPLRSTVSFV